jgi:HlyD family secretion protein
MDTFMDVTPMTCHKGERSEIKIGMICEAQVITRKEKTLFWLLEKINLKRLNRK